MIKQVLLFILINTMIIGCQGKTETTIQTNKGQTMQGDFFNPKTWKTFCTGRYLIDLPAALNHEVVGDDSVGKDGLGRDVIVWEKSIDTPTKLTAQVNQIKRNIANFKKAIDPTTNNPPRKDGKPYFVREIKYKNGGVGILARANPTGEGMRMYNYFVTEKPFRVFYYRNEFVFENNIEETIALNQKIANSLHARGDNEIPKGSGICIYGGFIAGNHQDLVEETSIRVNYPYYSEKYYFQIGLANIVTEQPMTLHPKERLENKKIKKTLLDNTNKITSSGIKGKEWGVISRPPLDDDIPYYDFLWDHAGTASSSLNPDISMYMGYVSRGYKKNKVFPEYLMFANDKQAIEFWNNILLSLRKRPE